MKSRKKIGSPRALAEAGKRLAHFAIVVAAATQISLGVAYAGEAPMTEFFVQGATTPMYVQHWRSNPDAPVKKGPLMLVHGGSHTGVGWTTTPGGRPGWAFTFVDKGWDVYLVDWPGTGRSGTFPENLTDTPSKIVTTLEALLDRIGPAPVVGHSIGAALAFKLAERDPERVMAVAAMAPASVETVGAIVPPSPLDKLVGTTRDGAKQRFTSSPKFPDEAFDTYFASLVLYGPDIRNAAIGLTDEMKIDQSKRKIWNNQVPLLLLAAEDDRTVPPERTEQTAKALGITPVYLAKDWGLEGHGHMFVIENDTEVIAEKVEAWLSEAIGKRSGK